MSQPFWSSRIPGIILTLSLAIVAVFLSPMIPRMNEVLLGLIFGVVLGNIGWQPDRAAPGIAWTGKTVLNTAIIFLGFGISFQHMTALGSGTLWILILTLVIILFLTWSLANLFGCKTTTGWLVGFGTAICGSAAIAALSASLTREKEDIGIALAVVNLLGLLGMLAFPAVLAFWPQSDPLSATLIGGTLHGVGNVAGAGYALGDHIGDLALTVKLGRVALLVPGLIFFNFLANRSASWRDQLKLPYYLWGFLIVVTLVSFVPFPAELLTILKEVGKVLLTMAMVAIGLGIRFSQLYRTGRVALGFGLIMFILQILVVLGLAVCLL
ncbi:MAG: putative sulfate exporter family transporter [Saprospiraceae bacterium]|nr:putative sulfate exporter family transporter [Saprospiraceae bacterium]